MKVLFVVGYCLRANSSANLCHAAYINGFLDEGHVVDLLTVSSKNQKIDSSIELPKVRNIYEYEASYYEQYANKKYYQSLSETDNFTKKDENSKIKTNDSLKSRIAFGIKELIRKSYGPYLTDQAWFNRAKHFKSNEYYDLVVSLVHPPVSAKVANYLIKHKRIQTSKAIQIWEDPWSSDTSSMWVTRKSKPAEEKLFEYSDKTIYVSPLTLDTQKKYFPQYENRMCWHPLPSYYQSSNDELDFGNLVFGYFGDYVSDIRNLKPFLDTAYNNNSYTYVCGSTDLSVHSKDNITIKPRLPLNELKIYEDKANVIIFLCNLKGGQIPGKIYQYSATNKAILFILDGTEEEKKIIKDYFSKYNRYIFCENNEESIKEAIGKISELVRDPCYTMPLDNFEAKNIVKEILKEVNL